MERERGPLHCSPCSSDCIPTDEQTRVNCSIQLSELNRIDVLNVGGVSDLDNVGFTGHAGQALGVNLLTTGLGLSLEEIVGADTVAESLTGFRLADVLNTHVDALGDDAVSDLLVDDNTNGVLGNIEDFAGLAVVELVGDTLLNATVSDDINVLTLVVREQESTERGGTVSPERACEEISCAGSLSKAMGHLVC